MLYKQRGSRASEEDILEHVLDKGIVIDSSFHCFACAFAMTGKPFRFAVSNETNFQPIAQVRNQTEWKKKRRYPGRGEGNPFRFIN